MALYIPHSIFHLARLLYVRPETFGPNYVVIKAQPPQAVKDTDIHERHLTEEICHAS